MSDVRVNVTDAAIISALNTPGGAVYEWRDDTMLKIANRAYDTSPVNNPLNAQHRGGEVGTYKLGWRTRRTGNQHRVGMVISNDSDHAVYVEFGRSASGKYQAFTWAKASPPGSFVEVGGDLGGGTAGRPGRNILRNATNYVMRRATGGAYADLA